MDLNLIDFDLLPIKTVKNIISTNEEVLYDITIDGDHTFFIKLPNSENSILVHNCDGDHIASMLIGWFKRFAPNLFAEGKIGRLITPVIMTVDKNEKMVDYFLHVSDFKEWESKHPENKNKVVYLKGLGSNDKESLIKLFNEKGLDNFIDIYTLDNGSDKLIDDWLGDDAEARKEHLRNSEFDINNI